MQGSQCLSLGMKILLVEDEAELATSVQRYLAQEHMVCEWAPSYAEAMDKLAAFDYDMLVLDLMLPDGDGLSVLRALRDRELETGVLIVSAKNALDDKLRGFDWGADDYLTKPFHLPELNARLKAYFRRKHMGGQEVIRLDALEMLPEAREVRYDGNRLDLTGKEFDLLLYFLSNRGRVLTKQAIAEHLWGDYVDTLDHFDFVYQHIKNLRKKLQAADAPAMLHTVYGLGYRCE